jgi:hypothetical protein
MKRRKVDSVRNYASVRIAAHRGQGFQSNVDSDSSGTWTGVWRERGQFAG